MTIKTAEITKIRHNTVTHHIKRRKNYVFSHQAAVSKHLNDGGIFSSPLAISGAIRLD
jgi:DNA-binding CsgD family transcriptional regulator